MAVIDPPFCTPDDVAGIWRPLTDDEASQVEHLIDDASAMILEIPAVAVRIEAGTLSAATLSTVTKHMVRRVMVNPAGLRQFSTTVDDATKSGTYDVTMASGQLYISDVELDRLLGRDTAGTQDGAFSIRPVYTPGYATAPPWVESWT